MKDLVYGHRYKLAKRCGVTLLILAHLLLTTPLPEVHAMESENYRINESAISSGSETSAQGAVIPYASIGEPAVGDMVGNAYKVSLGYINTIASNPPVFTGPLPNGDMRVMWNKGESNANVFDLDNYFSSSDNSALTYTVEGTSSIIADIDTNTHEVSFSQDALFYGSEKARFIATDENGNRTKSNYVVLVVKDALANNPPIIYPIDTVTANEVDLVSITPVTFDPDGDALTVTFTSPLKDDGTWQTTYDDAGTYTVTATVSDSSLTDSESFTIEVRNVNRPPVIEPIEDITDKKEGDLITLSVSASDPDGDDVTISYPAPFDSNGTWQTSYTDNGNYALTVTASDGDLTSQVSFNLTVANVNGPPSVTISSDKSNVSPGDEFIVTVMAEDPDGDELKLTLTQDGVIIPGYDGITLQGPTFSTDNPPLSINTRGNYTIEAVLEEVDPQGPNTTPPNYYDDLDTKFLGHFDGLEGSQTVIDESNASHAVTAYGDAHLDTTNIKFGTSSLALDGDGDYLSLPDSNAWFFGSGDFTIDCWINLSSLPVNTVQKTILFQGAATPNDSDNWRVNIQESGGVYTFEFIQVVGQAGSINIGANFVPVVGTWYHLALTRSGTTWRVYIDGVKKTEIVNATAIVDLPQQLIIGARADYPADNNRSFHGYIDELRITKGLARWTENFEIPTNAYGYNTWRYSDSLIINVEEASAESEYFPLSGDFNGDGLTDLGYYNRALGTWKIALSNNGTFGAFEYWINGNFGKSNQYFYPLTGDFDGGGKTDIGFIRVPISTDGVNASYIKLAISNGVGFDVQNGRWRQSNNIELHSNWEYTILTGDFNGDGLTDIGQINVKQNEQVNIGITKNNLRPAALSTWGSNINISDFASMAGDFNGDGLTDLCFYKDSSKVWDVMVSQGGDSTGGNFSSLARWLSDFGGTDKDPILGDFNTDGLTDVGYVEKESGQWVIKYALSNGTSFIPDKDANNNDIPYTYPTGISDSTDGTLITGDMNGDGLFDVAAFDKTTREWMISLHHSRYPDLLVGIDNGIGGRTTIEYKDSVIYDNTGADDLPDLPFSVRVVSKVTQDDGLGRAYTTRYFYENGFFEPKTREFRGFGRVEVIDAEGSVKETYFYQDAILKGRPQKEVIKDNYNKIYSETAYNWLKKSPWNALNDVVVTADETLRGERSYTSLAVNSGVTLTIDDTSTFYIRDDVTVNGAIQVKQGTFTISAANINIGANGKITTATSNHDTYGTIVIEADSINISAGGVIEEDITDTVAGRSYSGSANVVDRNFSTSSSYNSAPSGTARNFSNTLSFDSMDISRVAYAYDTGGYHYDGSSSATAQIQLYYDGAWSTIDSASCGTGGYASDDTINTTGWSGVTQMRLYSTLVSYDTDTAVSSHREMRAFGKPRFESKSPEVSAGYIFPYLASKTSTVYDPQDQSRSKSTKVEYTYDDYGNVINIKEYGFDAAILKQTNITYADPELTKWIIGKPATSTLYEGDGVTKLAESRYYYDNLALQAAPDKGNLTKEEKWLKDAAQDTYIATTFTYDASGNVETVTDARANTTTTTYEVTKTFPASVKNTLLHTQQFTYDNATGKILTSTDPNAQVTTSTYDSFGRLDNVIGPGDISEVTYKYDLDVFPTRISTTTVSSRGAAGAADETISSFTFIDGLGRQILSRVQAENQESDLHIVSGEVEYDSRGQVIRKYLPYYITVPATVDAYAPPVNNTPYMSYTYDAMGRLVKTVRPDNKASYVIYDLTVTKSINENGQRAKQTKDALGRIIEIVEANGSITRYEYDTLGNLVKTIDAQNNAATIQYDTLGRKISMNDPDMGNWSYSYDGVGNLTSQTDAKGQTITFQYDAINRLTYKSTDVTYTYDQNTNGKGRLSSVTDSSGITEFFYDILGREEKTIKTINGSSYTIERTYDSLDRLLSVIYPDTTTVSYIYNKQGGIETISGIGTDYVKSVDYNANGQITHIEYGNDTSTDYDYDPYNFRLDNLVTAKGTTPIQDLSYNFDPIGNVTSIQDYVNTNTQNFGYDNINRLTYANGASYGVINYAYDSIGNMTQKGGMTMTYGGIAGPHAVTSVSGTKSYTIDYDSNGNMTRNGSADYTYDIENRLTKVVTPKGGGGFDISIDLQIGWNFISLPGNIPNAGGSIETILSSIDGKYEQVSRYVPSAIPAEAGIWKHFVKNSKFDQFSTFEYGEGYLIYMKEAATLELSGFFPLSEPSYPLKTGWNLICAPTSSSIGASEALAGVTYTSLKAWNGTSYEDATTLEAGKSYWVYVASGQTWNPPLSEVTTTYTYDGDGGRVLRQTEDEATLYIGSSFEAIGPPGLDATKQTKHIFMGSTRICSIEATFENKVLISEEKFYTHGDHLGSSNVITDDNGDVVNILEYTPYGTVSRNTGNYSTDKRFTGKIWDESSALSYYGARYYSPELGSFITADPTIQRPYDPQDFNRYAYARNNPVKYIDPTGYGWWSALWSFIAGLVGAVVTILVSSVAGPILGGMAGGAVSGAILGAVSGGLSGALKGAMWGAVFGGILGAGYQAASAANLGGAFLAAAAVGGAAYASATGGAEGLGDFAAGALGAVYGSAMGNALVDKPPATTSKSTSSDSDGKVENLAKKSVSDGQTQKGRDTAAKAGDEHRLISQLKYDEQVSRSALSPRSIFQEKVSGLLGQFHEKIGLNTQGKYFSGKQFWAKWGLMTMDSMGGYGTGVITAAAAPPPWNVIAGLLVAAASITTAVDAYKGAWVSQYPMDTRPSFEVYRGGL
ncbi:MAG: hypothetical protein NG740_02665 [Omnitrophica bacterium]|nr:hypothetical protein [Candidatus Omnitrophota bacterium]